MRGRRSPLRDAALAFLLVAVLVPRLKSLGVILTIDELLWRARGAQFLEGLATLDFPKTFTQVQPGVTTAWLAALARPWELLAASQAAVALAVSLGLLVSAYLLVRLTSFWTGMAAAAVLALDPFFIAHSRVVHTDALLATFQLLSVLFLLLFRREHARRYLLLSAVAGGLTVLTKQHGFLLWAFVPLLLLAAARLKGASARSALRPAAAWVGIALLTVVLLWPALWVPTPRNARAFVDRMKIQLAEERGRGGEEHWWYYGREFVFRLTPAATVLAPIGLLAAGVSRVAGRRRRADVPPGFRASHLRETRGWVAGESFDRVRDRLQGVVLPVAVFGILHAVVLSALPTKGDRWILITFLAADLAALAGALALSRWAARAWRRPALAPPLAAAVVVGLIGLLAADAARLHPYYLAHYNRLFPIASDRKLGWGEGLEQVAVFLERRPDAGAPVVSYFPRVLAHFYRGEVERLVRADEPRYRYVVLYRSMFERPADAYESDFLRRYLGVERPLHVVTINGLPYAWVYENQGRAE